MTNAIDANEVDVNLLINDTTHRLTAYAENVARLKSENERAFEFRDE